MKDNNIVQFFLRLFSGIEIIINGFVSMIVNIFTALMVKVAPVAAPIAPSFAIYTALIHSLEAPFFIALAASIAIEIVGMFSAKVTIACYQWTEVKNATDEPIPYKVSLVMSGLFFLVAFVLAISIEIWSDAKILIYPGFVIIAISTYINTAINAKLKTLTDAKEELASERKERKEAKAELKMLSKQIDTAKSTLRTTADEIRANNKKIKNYKQELDATTQAYIANLETTINDLQLQLSEQAEAPIILEAMSIVEHRVKELDETIDTIEPDKTLLSGLAANIAEVIIKYNGAGVAISTVAKELKVSSEDIIKTLKDYKGKRFVKINGDIYAVPKGAMNEVST